MDWMPILTDAVIPLTIIIVAYLLRGKLGETEADRIVKLSGQRVARTRQYIDAANVAVVAIENGVKKYGTVSDEELQKAALDIMLRTLEEWGIVVSPSNVSAMAGLVEYAYQALKEANVAKAPTVLVGNPVGLPH